MSSNCCINLSTGSIFLVLVLFSTLAVADVTKTEDVGGSSGSPAAASSSSEPSELMMEPGPSTTADDYTGDNEYDEEDAAVMDKRHLGSIAALSGPRPRGSVLFRQPLLSDMEDMWKYKRFLGSLTRSGWRPRQFRGEPLNGYGLRQESKRHIGSVARMGFYPQQQQQDKRHIGSIARMGFYPQQNKRHIGSIARMRFYPGQQEQVKRHIGSIARMGFQQQVDKRHIGAVARMGWLPATRSREDFWI